MFGSSHQLYDVFGNGSCSARVPTKSGSGRNQMVVPTEVEATKRLKISQKLIEAPSIELGLGAEMM